MNKKDQTSSSSEPQSSRKESVFPWLLTPTEHGNSIPKRPDVNPAFVRAVGPLIAKRVLSEESPVSPKGQQASPDSKKRRKEPHLSREGETYIDNVRYALSQVRKKLIETGGVAMEVPQINGQSYVDYMEIIANTIQDEREYQYIVETIDTMIVHLDNFRLKILSYTEAGVPIPKEVIEPLHRTGKHWATPPTPPIP